MIQFTYHFTSRQNGNLSQELLLKEYIMKCHLDSSVIVRMNQMHGIGIARVTQKDENTTIPNTDGLIVSAKDITTSLILVVKSADCLPILFIDKTHEIFAVAHAGWKGIYNQIPSHIISHMKKLGSKSKDIQVIIGPHIHDCCYEVDYERAHAFTKKFGNDSVINRNKKTFLDLSYVAREQIVAQGIDNVLLDMSNECTSCKSDKYFSYRNDYVLNKARIGHQVGILAISRYN